MPSYLVPTYSALQYKKSKIEAKVEKGFAFGKTKGNKADFLDWASGPKEQEEHFVDRKKSHRMIYTRFLILNYI